ncbi:MAG TPA: phosphoribosylformylglycinamidine synthase subunit PurS [Saprospiraceae bacterium]|nr:phosphoribosylformylglycinamidine synthase subunit PurS [Saprospiraceae bacterium]
MKYKAAIDIMPHKELLDPQGKTVARNLHNVDIHGVESVRIGKHIEMILETEDRTSAEAKVEEACKKLLANLIMETYHFSVTPVTG